MNLPHFQTIGWPSLIQKKQQFAFVLAAASPLFGPFSGEQVVGSKRKEHHDEIRLFDVECRMPMAAETATVSILTTWPGGCGTLQDSGPQSPGLYCETFEDDDKLT